MIRMSAWKRKKTAMHLMPTVVFGFLRRAVVITEVAIV